MSDHIPWVRENSMFFFFLDVHEPEHMCFKLRYRASYDYASTGCHCLSESAFTEFMQPAINSYVVQFTLEWCNYAGPPIARSSPVVATVRAVAPVRAVGWPARRDCRRYICDINECPAPSTGSSCGELVIEGGSNGCSCGGGIYVPRTFAVYVAFSFRSHAQS